MNADTLSSPLFTVEGGRELSGRTEVPGSKHGMVLVFAAAVALGAKVTLENVPQSTEFEVLSDIVHALGGTISSGDRRTCVVDGEVSSDLLPGALTRRIHGSIYLLAAVLAQRGAVTFGGAGGDELGTYEFGLTRPIQQILDVMALFGADWSWQGSELTVRRERLVPATVDILRWSDDPERPAGPRVSSATKAAVLMAAATPGTSVILNPHDKEAQRELMAVLRELGVDIEQRDRCWIVRGRPGRQAARYRLMPDPVEVITWQSVAVMTGSSFELDCGDTSHLVKAIRRELEFLDHLGIKPEIGDGSIRVSPAVGSYVGAQLIAESTGISTDIAPLLALVLLKATGRSTVEDRVWRKRFGYAAPLKQLGASTQIVGERLSIEPSILRPTEETVLAADTRSVAVCLVAALAVAGRTTIDGIEHLARGYEALPERLAVLGADIAYVRRG
ncbi:hypothetical protein [Nocardia asiatica]|uniref:hypothetical protein n=1 Tax=Nocardia asiatica TaxID=209252 RepID=UPI0024590371|nr:hypothetical protein [Nocardia asiatica]